MDKMPLKLRNKLMQLAKARLKAQELDEELTVMLDSYGIDCERLNGCSYVQPCTEALAFIVNAESRDEEGINDSIDQIEEVFLHIVNNELK